MKWRQSRLFTTKACVVAVDKITEKLYEAMYAQFMTYVRGGNPPTTYFCRMGKQRLFEPFCTYSCLIDWIAMLNILFLYGGNLILFINLHRQIVQL